jgi:hypothetical protein
MPPRRQPTLPPIEPEEPVTSVEDLREEDLDAEVERLQRQLAERRKRSQIVALRRELAGEMPEETESHKRGLSVSSSTASAKRVHIRAKERSGSVRDVHEERLRPDIMCYLCRKSGHIAKNCPTRIAGQTPAKPT